MNRKLFATALTAPFLIGFLFNPALPFAAAQAEKPQKKSSPAEKAKPAPAKRPSVSGITFDLDYLGKETGGDNSTFVAVRSAAEALGWPVSFQKKTLYLNNKPLPKGPAAPLPNGSWVMPVRQLEDYGAKVVYTPGQGTTVSAGNKSFDMELGKKRVVVDLAKQRMTAYQGGAVVLYSGISSGRDGHETPIGTFKATEYKDRDHKSSLYDAAPMPWSVQIVGNIFFHGYDEVERRPRSHGCIRLPMEGRNPARFLFYWITPGTSVEIVNRWKK